jgi:hypothetical protein
MAGRMGQDTVTVKNLEVIEITADGVLLIKGLVPGSVNSMVVVKKMGTNKKFVPLYKEVVEEPVVEAAIEGTVSEEIASSSSVSEDAKPTKEETSESETASLNDSQQPDVMENKEAVVEPTISSSEDVQAPSAQDEEVKTEVKEGEDK